MPGILRTIGDFLRGPVRQQIDARLNICEPTERLPYRRRNCLLTPTELRFYHALCRAVGRVYEISIKMRLVDVVECPDFLWKSYGRRISQKHVDFVLYERASAEIVVAIELDDPTHLAEARQARDKFLDEVLLTGDVVLVRVYVAPTYDEVVLWGHIKKAIATRDQIFKSKQVELSVARESGSRPNRPERSRKSASELRLGSNVFIPSPPVVVKRWR
jgi:hypothetical protein